MLFPEILEDESLYSLIARLAILNGLSPQRLVNDLALGGPPRAADLNINLRKFTDFTNGIYGDGRSVLEIFHNRQFDNTASNDCHILIEFSNPSRNIWKWCPECARDEVTNTGVAYWHNQFQNICVLACIKHQIPLREINLHFRDRQSRFILPSDANHMSHYASCDKTKIKTAIKLAEIQKALSSTKFQGNPYVLKEVFEKNPSYDNWAHDFNETLQVLSKGNQRSISFMKSILTANPPSLSFLAALINISYGSYEFFLNCYQWKLVILTEHKHDLPEKLSISTFDRKFHRSICKAHLLNFPESKRKDFWKLNPKSCKWLNANDAAWFEKILPSKKRKVPIQLKLI